MRGYAMNDPRSGLNIGRKVGPRPVGRRRWVLGSGHAVSQALHAANTTVPGFRLGPDLSRHARRGGGSNCQRPSNGRSRAGDADKYRFIYLYNVNIYMAAAQNPELGTPGAAAAFTRYCFSARLLCKNQPSMHSPPPTCIAHPGAIRLHDYSAVNDSPFELSFVRCAPYNIGNNNIV